MVFKTYKDISAESSLSVSFLRQLAYKLQIKAKIIGGISYFAENQVFMLLTYTPPKKQKKEDKRELSIIEDYQRTGSARKTASNLRLQKQLVNDVVNEWTITGCVTVESSLNFERTSKIKNIRKYGGKWLYEYTKNGVLHYKNGFTTEDEAFTELTNLKERLRSEG